MKPRTLIALCIVALFAVMSACSGVDRELLPTQQKNIVSYLGGKEYVVVEGVYRYIANADRDGYDDQPVVQWGDSVYFDYATYPFTTAPQTLAATNIFALIQGDTIINTQYWSFDPVGVKLGTTQLLDGLQRGLPGCHRGDSVVLLFTSDLAYRDKAVGTIPQNSAVMMSLKILTVK